MFTMNKDVWLHGRETGNRLWTSTDKRTRWMQMGDGLNTSHSHTRRMCVEGTSCPSGTRCLDEHIIVHNERRRAFDYFVTTISTRPSRRRMLMPTSFAWRSSERSTTASPILRFFISMCSRKGGKTGCENDRRARGASIRKPRQDWSSRNTATEDQV